MSKKELCLVRLVQYSLALFWLISVLGCGRPSLEQEIVGRWLENQDNRIVEFTSNGLYGIHANGSPVEVGSWKVVGKELHFQALTESKLDTWTIEMKRDSFTVDVNKALFRKFDRAVSQGQIFDQRLQGVWRNERSEKPEIVEFTPQGTFVGVFRRLNDKKENIAVGCLGEVARASSNEFFLDGELGDRRMARVIQHQFAIEGGKLHWGKGRRRKPEVYRPISRADVENLKDQ